MVEIVVTGHLERSIKRRLPEAEAAAFSADRVSGRVGAKMIPTATGCAIVVDGRFLVPGVADGAGLDVPRIFEHEGWHGALARHHEDFAASYSRASVSGARAHCLGQALVLIDDYRIELALIEQGHFLDESYVPSLVETLDGCAAALRDAVTLRYPGEPMTRCYETTVPAFNSLTTHLSYLAAADAEVSSLRQHPRWRRLVGEHYDLMSDALARVPSAAVRVEPRIIDTAGTQLEEVLKDWLRDVGFELRDLADGRLYMDVLRHDF